MAISKLELAAKPDVFVQRMDKQIQKFPMDDAKALPFKAARDTYLQMQGALVASGFKFTGNEKTTFSFIKSGGDQKLFLATVKKLSTLFKGAFRIHPRYETKNNGYWLVKELNGVKMSVLVVFSRYPGAKEDHVYVSVSPYSTKPMGRGWLVQRPEWED